MLLQGQNPTCLFDHLPLVIQHVPTCFNMFRTSSRTVLWVKHFLVTSFFLPDLKLSSLVIHLPTILSLSVAHFVINASHASCIPKLRSYHLCDTFVNIEPIRSILRIDPPILQELCLSRVVIYQNFRLYSSLFNFFLLSGT